MSEERVFTVEVVTLVPEIWPVILGAQSGLVGRAFAEGRTRLYVSDLRDFGQGRHRQVDDSPYGGGAGMVLCAPPLVAAIERAKARSPGPVILLSPRGKRISQEGCRALARGSGFTLVCGRYEGIDERVRAHVDAELSLGDFVLSAGEPAAWALIDAVVRLLPGVLGNESSLEEESFAKGLLEYPQYTRPAEFRGAPVPDVLLSGDHARIAAWRQEQAKALTERLRPDLMTALP